MSTNEKLNDVELSCNGIDMLVNNDWEGCEKLFSMHKDLSPLMHFCNTFMSYMKAVLTFEDQLLEKAQKDLEHTEKLCANPSGMFSSFKKAFKLSNNAQTSQVDAGLSKQQILEEKFTKAIILADCKLYSAILTFIRQDVSAYLSSGILQMRKSWKMYAKIQKQLYTIYKSLEPNAEQIYGSDPNSNVIELWIEGDDDSDAKTSDKNNNNDKNGKEDDVSLAMNDLVITDEETSQGLSLETTKRLLGAVSFGYGLFQICLSFMPANILKLIKVFGFEGDRSVALKAINFTSLSRDMRAPFADLILLWYSTIATPMFGIGEGDLQISNDDTKLILEKNLKRYPKSSLFLYMRGKFNRSIMRDLNAALANYEEALSNSAHIREIQLISIYETGWIHLCQLDYTKALENFQVLQKESKWSKCFFTYVCAIVNGALGKYAEANAFVKEAIKIFNAQHKKNNPIELFAMRRNEYLKKNSIKSKELCELFIVELLYLWVNLPYCDDKVLSRMLQICDQINDKKFVPIKCLFEGVVNMGLKNKEFGEQCLNECQARCENDKSMAIGKYVMPSALYELACYYVEEKDFASAKANLSKAQSYKDYELDNRIQVQIRSLQRKIKYLTEPKPGAAAAASNSNDKLEAASKSEEIQKQKNFFIS